MATTTDNKLIDLTSSANGAVILFATDEWFAVADNLLNPSPPVFDPDAFCKQGKVMDGWESRRKRTPGHDWCVIALGGISSHAGEGGDGTPMTLNRIELDTAFFTGNQTPRVSVEAMRVTAPRTNANVVINDDFLYNWMPGATTRLAHGGGVQGTSKSTSQIDAALAACKSLGNRIEILPMAPLKPGYEESRYHSFELSDESRTRIEALGGVTHLILNYFPDGGVARMKVYGRPIQGKQDDASTAVMEDTMPGRTIVNHDDVSSLPLPSTRPHPAPELSSELHGGVGLAQSNAHYGVSGNLLLVGPGINMGDGWETARHPDRPPVIERDPATGLQNTHLLDWSLLKLGLGGADGIDRIIVDTRHFKGNFPESVAIDGCVCASDDEVCNAAASSGEGGGERGTHTIEWFPLLKRTRMTAHAEHEYTSPFPMLVNMDRYVTHVRVSIRPDGGLSRVRIYGFPKASVDVPGTGSKL